MKLLDVSSNNHTGALFNWQAVKAAGIDGVYVKATQGTQYTNPYLLMDTRDARAAGLAVGIYHFYDAAVGDPEAQAQHFIASGIEQVDKGACTLMPVFDYEQGNPDRAIVEAFCDAMPGGAMACAQYMDRSFFDAIGPYAAWTWLAWPGWSGELLPPTVHMVQTGSEVVPGIPGVQTDIDVTTGDITMAVPVPSGPKLGGAIVGAERCTTGGYWLVGGDGGVFAYGCENYGNMVGKPHAGIVAIVGSATGRGYALIASDGGVFAFGDFVFMGSVPGSGIGPA